MTFKEIQSDLYKSDQSYSSLLLNRIRNNARWVSKNRGSHVTLAMESHNNDLGQRVHERPFASVRTNAIFMRIPWWVGPSLKKIHFRALCRVSNGYRDDKGYSPLWPGGEHVRLSAKLLGDGVALGEASNSVEVSPMLASGKTYPQWGIAGWTYEIGETLATRDTYHILALALKSATPIPKGGTWMPSSEPEGLVDMTGFDPIERLPHRIKADTNGFYDNGPAATAPNQGANEITATALISVPEAERHVRDWADHMERQRNVSGHGMYIWPPTQHASEDAKNYDPPITHIARFHVPYIQFRSIEIWEEHAE